ncbi:unnamed protein product, partial [Cladocopium goreaui]
MALSANLEPPGLWCLLWRLAKDDVIQDIADEGELGSCYWMMRRFHGMARCVHLTAALLQVVYRSCLFASVEHIFHWLPVVRFNACFCLPPTLEVVLYRIASFVSSYPPGVGVAPSAYGARKLPPVEERDTNSLLLDVAATDLCHVAHVITDGLVGAETRVLPILGLLCKSRREQSFPMDLLQKGLSVDIAAAQASKEEDKTRILNSVRCPRARTWALDTPFPTQHPRYDAVNRALASHFALTSIQQSYRNGQAQAPSSLWQALRSDAERKNIQVSLTGCHSFRDPDLRILMDNLPSQLQSLRLDLAYTGLERLDDLAGASGASFGNALQTLVIRFAGSLRSISGLSALLCPSLR